MWARLLLFGLFTALVVHGQNRIGRQEPSRKLPDGRDQTEAILKDDHQRNLKDAAEMLKLVEEIRKEMERDDRHVLSLGVLKKLEEIEKISRRIRGRLKRL